MSGARPLAANGNTLERSCKDAQVLLMEPGETLE